MTPYPYQIEGAKFLAARKRGGLLDGCRVGKTIQGVVACDLIGARSVLVVCPGLARSVWANTFDSASLMGLPRATVWDVKDPIEPNGVTIISMDNARNLAIRDRIMHHRWDVMIVDEQHFLKTPTSKRTQMVLSRDGFASVAGRIWFLTATPVMKDPSDLFTMLVTVGAFKGTHEDFLNRYCNWYMGDHGPVVTGAKNVEELQRLMAPHFLRRTWEDVKHQVTDKPVPAPIWEEIDIVPKEGDYDPSDLRDIGFLENEKKVKRIIENFLAGDAKPLPRNSDAARVRLAHALVKAKPLAGYITERLAKWEWDKVVIFFHHFQPSELLMHYLLPFKPRRINGKTPDAKRDQHIREFTDKPAKRVLLVQDNIARQAIDLSAANRLVFFELDWIDDNNHQAAMRIQGPRQTRQPYIYVSRLIGSMDEIIARAAARRARMSAQILDSNKPLKLPSMF
ncbi:SNF2-related protein [Pannonibacter tanglangensis]|uniref:Uncharacterized protein n=1 Tax=Pannonibacter tanglangensis TaxID=2750084 RepID=A0ABW9ZDH8_9HYPH|nr:DEAD/DEAH box helicase [Pannonibacter sp. XCT-34]NBN62083.1 hypothetical protein [Pannonibacter sp. XCT-34]